MAATVGLSGSRMASSVPPVPSAAATGLSGSRMATSAAAAPLSSRRQRLADAKRKTNTKTSRAAPKRRTPSRTLDGFLMLEAAAVDDPDDARRVVLEGCQIRSAQPEDLAYFGKLTHLDLGDNALPLASLAHLPALRELHLDCNGLVHAEVPTGGFPALEVLNLAFNGLSAPSIRVLASLPRLRHLDISHNGLEALPDDWSRFASLERLDASHNQLADGRVLEALWKAPRLVQLDLAHNAIDVLSLPDGAPTVPIAHLSLAHNRISREAYLLPLLHLPRLAIVELWGNPCLRGGRAASAALHAAFSEERRVELRAAPPPPPPPRPPPNPRRLCVVEESFGRLAERGVLAESPMPHTAAEVAAEAADEAPAGPSFFLTSDGAGGGAGGEEQRDAEAADDDEEEDENTFARIVEELAGAELEHGSSNMAGAMARLRRVVSRDVARAGVAAEREQGAGRLTSSVRARVRVKFARGSSDACGRPSQWV